MNRFVFKLEPVLEHRRRLERERQMEVAKIEAGRVSLEGRIKEIQGRIEAGRGELRTSLGGGGSRMLAPVAVAAARLSAHSSLHGLVLLQRVAIELAGLHARLNLARRALLAAATARKAVEVIRERQLEAWKAEVKWKEERMADDMMVMRAPMQAEVL